MSTFVLDSSAYFRLAKSFHPLLGNHGELRLKLLPETATEFDKQPRLRSKFSWFDSEDFSNNRQQNLFLSGSLDAEKVKNTAIWLRDWVKDQRVAFSALRLNPPSPTDCTILAHAVMSGVIIVADDRGLEHLAKAVDLPLIGSHHLLKQLLDANRIKLEAIQSAARYLDYEGDLPAAWKSAAQSLFGCKLP